jgi:hypothetical protein
LSDSKHTAKPGTNNERPNHLILNKRFVFILGASRSGTTWMQSILSYHPEVCTYPELKIFSHYLKPWLKSWEWDQKDTAPHGLPAIWEQDEFYGFLKQFLNRIYGRVADDNPANSVIVDKIPQSNEIRLIETLISKPKYIHVVRDGRDVASSLIAASKGWGQAWAPSTTEAAAAWWRNGVQNAHVAKSYEDEGRYIEIHYEDMLVNDLEVISQVFEFIGLKYDHLNVDAIAEKNRIDKMKKRANFLGQFVLPSGFIRKGDTGGWEKNWNALDRYRFHCIAGQLLSDLGYANSSWWVKKPYQKWWIPLKVKYGPKRMIGRILKKYADLS